MTYPGYFISFEGNEGAGKSTQVAQLAQALTKDGYQVITLREPGGTSIGEAIRAITHDPANKHLSYRAEALLIAASRAQLIEEVYLPSLIKGMVVIADRYVDSSYAYQGIARELGLDEVKAVNDFAIEGLYPDLTLLIDVDPATGQQRRHGTNKVDRMDLLGHDFYERVNTGYDQIAHIYAGRIVRIDGSRSIETVHQEVYELVSERLAGQNDIARTA